MPDRDQRIGKVVDSRYRIIELLGSGGMGSVYRAEHIHLRRPVALKLVHPALGGLPRVAERFAREAVAVGRLKHDNCVAVQDFGHLEDGTLYLAMELVEGPSLSQLFSPDHPMPWWRAARIGCSLLAGLEHAHSAGIVHRDIKPENVIVTQLPDGSDFPKLLDFGIAKLTGPAARADGRQDLTEAGTAFGTPTYMAPEQATGDPIDGRTDLYQLSVLLYQLIAGVPPLKGEDQLETVKLHMTQVPPPLPAGLAPPALGQALMRGLSKRSRDRWPDAASYRHALQSLLAPQPQRGPAPPPLHRRWAYWAGGAAGLLFVIAVATGGKSDRSAKDNGSPSAGSLSALLSPGSATQEQAQALLMEHGDGDLSNDKLVELASGSRQLELRHQARDLAGRLGLSAKVDYRHSYELDLVQGELCQDRKQAVEQLRELGDKRAIRALRKARVRRPSGNRTDKKNINECLKDAAEEAINYLESR